MENIINIINLSTDQPASFLNPNYPPEKIKRSREERALSIVQQSKDFNIAIRFWEGEIAKYGFIGISRSFKKIVRWAKENNLKKVIVGEDDLLLCSKEAWEYYLENTPEDFDLWMGCLYSGEIGEDNRVMNGFSGGMTLCTIHSRFYDFFLTVNNKYDNKEYKEDTDHIDRACGNFCFEKKYYVSNPFVCRQMSEGYSDNHRKQVSHAAYLETMKFFGDPS